MALKPQANSAALAREVTAEDHIPFAAHIDRYTIKTQQGDYVQTFRIEGIAHETAHDDEIEVWHEQLALFMRNLNSPNLALWSYVVRRETGEYVEGEFLPGFAREFDKRYRKIVTQRRMFINELYLSLIYRPEPSVVARAAEKLDPSFRDKAKLLNTQQLLRNSAALERIHGFAGEVQKYLLRYSPERLGTYAYDDRTGKEYRDEALDTAPDDAVMFSEQLEFFGYILNGVWQRMPWLRADIAATMQTSRISVGKETVELRDAVDQVYGAALGWKEYPDPSFPGQLNELLRAPFEFILAQSFACLEKPAAISALKRQYNRLESTEDDAVGEVQALEDAIEGLASNEFAMGTHHIVMFVRWRDTRHALKEIEALVRSAQIAANDSTEAPELKAAHTAAAFAALEAKSKELLAGPDLRAFPSVVSEARRALSDCGAVVVREDLACEAAFYSMLAGNFGDRPRPGDMTSRNFVGFSSFHNYPSGKRDGNHWGPALALLKTASGAPFYFSFHRRDIGHFAMFGSTGAGKTVLVTFLITMLQKTDVTVILFDKDRGAEIAVRANRGRYFALGKGVPTGFNPFRLRPTPENKDFVQRLVRVLVRRAGVQFTARENNEIARAVNGVFELPEEHRRLGAVLAFLEPPTADNISARLLRWIHAESGEGQLSWVFDNLEDRLDFSQSHLFGLDMTYFLDDEEIRTPILLYLFHRINAVKDGRRGAVIIDEGWKALDDDEFATTMGDSLKTDRKKDWLLGVITQSPTDSLKSKIAHTISEQTATKIFLPNLRARKDDYVAGFGCTEGEFDTIRTLAESGRRFVVKQGENAVVCELDLGPLEDDLAVFSGTAANVALLDQIRARVGDDPDVWLPIYHEERKRG